MKSLVGVAVVIVVCVSHQVSPSNEQRRSSDPITIHAIIQQIDLLINKNKSQIAYLKCNADSSNLEAANIICESLAISDTLFFYDSPKIFSADKATQQPARRRSKKERIIRYKRSMLYVESMQKELKVFLKEISNSSCSASSHEY
jgi:hypothetical protein